MTVAEKQAQAKTLRTGVTRSALIEQLGETAGEEFFSRIDDALRDGDIVLGSNVRNARTGFGKVDAGHAMLVIPGRVNAHAAGGGTVDLSEGVVIMNMKDLEAVVKAGQRTFDWAAEFAPCNGLAAATSTPRLKPGSRGRRAFRG